MKKLLVLSLILMTLLSGCNPTAAEKEELTVLVSADYPPYESIDTNGKFVGFDIEFGELVAEEMGVTFKWVDTAFAGIIGALQAGTGDLAISGMSVTPEREESVDFSQIYKEEGGAFTVLFLADKGYDSIDDLTGLIASTQLGTIQEIALNNLKAGLIFTVDIRTPDQAKLDRMRARIEKEAAVICEALGVGCSVEAVGHFDPVTFDPKLVETVRSAALALREAGAREVIAFAAHGLFIPPAAQVLTDPAITSVIVTDSVPPFRLPSDGPVGARLVVVSAAPPFAQAIRACHVRRPA